MRNTIVTTCFVLFCGLVPALAHDVDNTRRISVRGEAEVRVPPDTIIITLGIETVDTQLDFARQHNGNAVKKLITAMVGLKIDRSHIQTEFLNIDHYEKRKSKDEMERWFRCRRTIVVEIRKIEGFEDILSAAFKNGATHVHSIQFRTSELRKYRDQARSIAIRAARDKAVALAGELGQTVGDPLSIGEGYSRWWSGYGSWWGSGRYNRMSQNVSQIAGSPSDNGGTIAVGQIAVTAQVSVTFEMTPSTGAGR